MKRFTTVLVCLLIVTVFSISSALAADTYLYRIDLRKMTTEPLVSAGIDLLTVLPNDHALAEMTDRQMTQVIRLGYAVDFLAENLTAYSLTDETDDYYTYTSLTSQLQAWADMNADIAVLYDLATTPQNHHVWGMKISGNPLLEEDEIVNYFVGVHHGNEDISMEVPMYFLGYIFDNYGSDPNVTYWVENREIWVIPLLNPDGFVNNSRYNGNGVDINRNYSFHWGESAYAYGPYPFSEVESQVVRDLNDAHHFTMGHSYHSYGEEILYPFAWASNHPSPDDAFFLEIVWAMAAMNGYDPLISGNLYPHGGEHNDYLYAEKGVMSVTTELWSGPGYNPPSTGIEAVCLDNLPNDLYLLERAGRAQITGLITDAASNEPLAANFRVLELWNPAEIYPRYSEPEFGRYRHLVIPGTYTLEVSKSGYTTQTFSNVVVTAGNPTVIDVALEFVGYPDVTIAMDPVNPPIVIPASGGSFSYNLTVSNNSGQQQMGDVWVDVTLPSGTVYGPLVLHESLNMPSGFAGSRLLAQIIPGSAPAGGYTMNGYTGNYQLSEIWHEEHFTFTKTGADNQIGSVYLPITGSIELQELVSASVVNPASMALAASPNPFNPTTSISFQLVASGYVNLIIYDITGREVVTLADGWQNEGLHRVTFDAKALSSGVYLAKIEAAGQTAVQKLVLMK